MLTDRCNLSLQYTRISIISSVLLLFVCEATEDNSTKYRDMKSILLWNSMRGVDQEFRVGNESFENLGCAYNSCYTTFDREWMSLDLFDAVVFHGIQYYRIIKNDFPSLRSAKQIYVYFSLEPPDVWGAMSSLNRYFNLTATQRLDSDIHVPYFQLRDNIGNVVSPSLSPKWILPYINASTESLYLENIYDIKTNAVVWYVSHCVTPSLRERYVRQLRNYISVDIYGKCTKLKCLKPDVVKCASLIRTKYYFFLAFESAICVDYLSEKVLRGLRNDAIPVLYGGADLGRFLPPKSYIDATKYDPRSLATFMKSLINNPEEYVSYFWWKQFYKIVKPKPFLCSLCEVLHDRKRKPYTYNNLRVWWHGNISYPVCTPGKEMLQSIYSPFRVVK